MRAVPHPRMRAPKRSSAAVWNEMKAGRPTMTDLTVVAAVVVVALAGAIVPEAVVIGCTLADAGIGKVDFEVGVELLLPAICL